MQNVFKAVVLWAVLPSLAHGLTLDLPAPVLAEESRSESFGSYALPLAPFDGQAVPARSVEGALDQRVFQLDAPDLTTLAVLDPLRAQILAAGYEVLLDCETEGCGGFDFRFGTEVMPEPDMHVDLGDFRFLSAEKGEEAISVLVSRSASSAYVQITRVGPAPAPVALQGESVDLDVEVPRALPAPVTGDIGAALDQSGAVVLEDLVFASGAAALAEGDYASLAALAAWLEANPDGTLALVGHTDASGSLAANIALSERRAEAVAQALVDAYGVEVGRISAEGVGFLAPRATNQTEAGRQKNRRVEAVVTSTR
ncbi:MAG: OmpA family protein [Alphaproteobacteria bacterium]